MAGSFQPPASWMACVEAPRGGELDGRGRRGRRATSFAPSRPAVALGGLRALKAAAGAARAEAGGEDGGALVGGLRPRAWPRRAVRRQRPFAETPRVVERSSIAPGVELAAVARSMSPTVASTPDRWDIGEGVTGLQAGHGPHDRSTYRAEHAPQPQAVRRLCIAAFRFRAVVASMSAGRGRMACVEALCGLWARRRDRRGRRARSADPRARCSAQPAATRRLILVDAETDDQVTRSDPGRVGLRAADGGHDVVGVAEVAVGLKRRLATSLRRSAPWNSRATIRAVDQDRCARRSKARGLASVPPGNCVGLSGPKLDQAGPVFRLGNHWAAR